MSQTLVVVRSANQTSCSWTDDQANVSFAERTTTYRQASSERCSQSNAEKGQHVDIGIERWVDNQLHVRSDGQELRHLETIKQLARELVAERTIRGRAPTDADSGNVVVFAFQSKARAEGRLHEVGL